MKIMLFALLLLSLPAVAHDRPKPPAPVPVPMPTQTDDSDSSRPRNLFIGTVIVGAVVCWYRGDCFDSAPTDFRSVAPNPAP